MESPWKIPVEKNGAFSPKRVILFANLETALELKSKGYNLKEVYEQFCAFLEESGVTEKIPYSTFMRNVKKRDEEYGKKLMENAEEEVEKLEPQPPEAPPEKPALEEVTREKEEAPQEEMKAKEIPEPEEVQVELTKEEENLKRKFEAHNETLEIKLSFDLFKAGYRITWWEWKKQGGGKTTKKERESICSNGDIQRMYEPQNCIVGAPDWDWKKNIFASNPYLKPVKA